MSMKCEVCDDTFETIQRIDEEVAPADDGTPFERVVEWKRCPTCGSGMKIWHTAFPKEPFPSRNCFEYGLHERHEISRRRLSDLLL